MISHKHKCIFIHIPKTAGTSVNEFFHEDVKFRVSPPNYDLLFGWCPKRKLHLQHATAKQLLETELIPEETWNNYFKFTFVRNPWDRAYSDYLWLQKYSGIEDSFNNYINKKGKFSSILNENTDANYLGDHLLLQTDFFDMEGIYKPNFIGRFENFETDMSLVLKHVGIKKAFNLHKNKTKRHEHYSHFYSGTKKRLVEKKFIEDISLLNYKFEDQKVGIKLLKKFI